MVEQGTCTHCKRDDIEIFANKYDNNGTLIEKWCKPCHRSIRDRLLHEYKAFWASMGAKSIVK